MEHLIALLPLLSSMPALQVFVGGIVAVTCVGMVLRANKDKHEVPPPAPGSVGDAMVHLQGPAEYLNILRDLREIGRQQVERLDRIAECGRVSRDQLTAQTELLRSIDREQVRHHGHD
ncbi:hypothetical protein [Methylobacterium aquaticum]|uniref:Uncharacterized protein n=1 Tax=Methylobacterium aquaticum TaxID=270351 RepID=A0A0C6EWJ0_9HYPH|nr:hypothetical protein [Methylobacterium aquaticum]BAQ44416.1 conserved in methylobacterium species, unknown protein [Methylobacterium aquaticum]